MNKVFLLILLLVFLVALGPLVFLWGVNELLEQAGTVYQIPFNFWSWLAAFAVTFSVAGRSGTQQ